MKTKTIASTILLLLSTMLILSTINTRVYANPANYTAKLNFHEVAETTLWSGQTTTHIMNTTTKWSSSTQEITTTLETSNTWSNPVTFFLYPSLAGQLSIPSQTAYLKLYLKANTTIEGLYIKADLYEVNSSTDNIIGEEKIEGAFSLNTAYQLRTVNYVISSATTVSTGNYIRCRIYFNSTESAPVNVTLGYDIATYPSRLELSVTDHITATVNTYLGNTLTTEFRYQDTINITATVTDAFGGYDIQTVKMYFVPTGFSNVVLPSDYGTGTLLSGSESSYTNVYYYLYTPTEPEYVPNTWTPYATVTDQSDNTITSSGTTIGVSGTGGEAPPSQPNIPWLPEWFYILGPQYALLLFGVFILFIAIAIVAVYLVIKQYS